MKHNLALGLAIFALAVSIFCMSFVFWEAKHLEEHAEEDLTRLFYILRAAEDGHANYISYEVPQADPFTRAQRVEYFNACGYAVVGEGRAGRFIVEKIGWRDAAGENKP